MEEIVIRDFLEEDRAAILEVVRQLQAAEAAVYDRMKPPEEIGDDYVRRIEENCVRYQGRILVAVTSGEVVGYAAVMTAKTPEDEDDEIDYTYAEIKDLAVIKSLRGRGLGSRLLGRCEQIARDAGAGWIRLSVLTDNVPARTFYEKSDFRSLVTYMEKPL